MDTGSIAALIDDMAKRFSSALPPGISNLRADVERNFRSALQSGLTKLDLVTRQEFDVQAAVLQRTREKLEQLEQRLTEFEAQSKKS